MLLEQIDELKHPETRQGARQLREILTAIVEGGGGGVEVAAEIAEKLQHRLCCCDEAISLLTKNQQALTLRVAVLEQRLQRMAEAGAASAEDEAVLEQIGPSVPTPADESQTADSVPGTEGDPAE